MDIGYVLNGLHTGFSEVQAVRVMDTLYVMNFPLEEDGSVIMPRPLPFDDRMQPKLSRAAIARAFAMRLP